MLRRHRLLAARLFGTRPPRRGSARPDSSQRLPTPRLQPQPRQELRRSSARAPACSTAMAGSTAHAVAAYRSTRRCDLLLQRLPAARSKRIGPWRLDARHCAASLLLAPPAPRCRGTRSAPAPRTWSARAAARRAGAARLRFGDDDGADVDLAQLLRPVGRPCWCWSTTDCPMLCSLVARRAAAVAARRCRLDAGQRLRRRAVSFDPH